jgi:hypothetical protein
MCQLVPLVYSICLVDNGCIGKVLDNHPGNGGRVSVPRKNRGNYLIKQKDFPISFLITTDLNAFDFWSPLTRPRTRLDISVKIRIFT